MNSDSTKVLVVDDEPLIRKILSKYMTDMKYTVSTAEDGLSALDRLDKEEFDLVLTDLNMPKMSGRELLQRMQQKYPDIPKIVLTGFGTNSDIILALQTGAYDFITKPITDFTILKHSVDRAVERKRLNDEKNRYMAQLSQMNEIISMLNSGKSTDEVFDSLIITMKKIIPFVRLSLVMYNKDDNTIITKMVRSDKQIILASGDRSPIEGSSLKQVLDTKDILYIKNLSEYYLENPNSKNTKALLDEGLKSTLVLPLIINGEIRGFLIFSSDSEGAYQQHHINFLQSIGGQISLSIQRGELLFEIEQHNRNLEQLVEKRTRELMMTQKTTIYALASLAETRDPETGLHLERMRNYSVLIAQILKYIGRSKELTNQYLRDLYDSSILHDIGKVGIPDGILLKRGKLDTDEFSIMKTHSTIGCHALKSACKDLGEDSFLKMSMEVTLHHHENWDGSGYPLGLKGNDIPLAARIVAIADVYDALSSSRPYKTAFPQEKTLQIMKEESRKFDPDLFKVFIENATEFEKIKKQINGE